MSQLPSEKPAAWVGSPCKCGIGQKRALPSPSVTICMRINRMEEILTLLSTNYYFFTAPKFTFLFHCETKAPHRQQSNFTFNKTRSDLLCLSWCMIMIVRQSPTGFSRSGQLSLMLGEGGSWTIWWLKELRGPLGLQAFEESSGKIWRTGLGGYSLCPLGSKE